jgi:hypothetical protein
MLHTTLVDLQFTPRPGLALETAVANFLFPSTDKTKPKPYVGMLEMDTVYDTYIEALDHSLV